MLGRFGLGHNKKGEELPKDAEYDGTGVNPDFDGVSLKKAKCDKDNHKVKIM